MNIGGVFKMSINWEASSKLNNCSIEDLEKRFMKFPKSCKHIIAICGACGKAREAVFNNYYDLCLACANKKRWSDPNEREKQSVRLKQAHIDDPTLSERQCVLQTIRWNDPKEHEKASLSQIKRWEDPKERERQSNIIARHYAGLDEPKLESCYHHIAYDFDRPEALTVKINRGFHSSIHKPKGIRVDERGYSLID